MDSDDESNVAEKSCVFKYLEQDEKEFLKTCAATGQSKEVNELDDALQECCKDAEKNSNISEHLHLEINE